MTTIDIRFDKQEMDALSNMVGKTMTTYKCDPFTFSTSVFGIVGFMVDDHAFKLTNTARPMDYFGAPEDVAVMTLSQTDKQSICSMIQGIQMVETPVGKRIVSIDVVNENQKLWHNGVQTYDVHLTRGIIFHFCDNSELSFEKNVWFSEDITIKRGSELVKLFTPAAQFAENWDSEYRAECIRTILTLTTYQ